MRISIYTVLLFVLGLTVIALAAGVVTSVLDSTGGEVEDSGSEVNQGYDCLFQNKDNPGQSCDISYQPERSEIYAV